MKNSLLQLSVATFLAPAWFAFGPSAAAAEVEKDLEHSFAVRPGGTLVIEADRGSIRVIAGGDEKVEVKVFRKASSASGARAEEILANHAVTFQQEGNEVRVRAESSKQINGWLGRLSNLQVRYEVAVPRQFNPDLRTAGGSVHVADLAGTVRVQTAGGSIRIGRIEGPVSATTSGGSIEIDGATDTIQAETAGGSVTVREAGADLDVQTSGGSINLGRVRGSARAHTAGGGIRIDAAGGRIDASTSGGSIRAALTGSPEEDCRFETSGGSIDLSLPLGVSAHVDARTSAGKVSCDLPVVVQGKAQRSSLEGHLGQGGKLLKLRTSAGNIRIRQITAAGSDSRDSA